MGIQSTHDGDLGARPSKEEARLISSTAHGVVAGTERGTHHNRDRWDLSAH